MLYYILLKKHQDNLNENILEKRFVAVSESEVKNDK